MAEPFLQTSRLRQNGLLKVVEDPRIFSELPHVQLRGAIMGGLCDEKLRLKNMCSQFTMQ